MYDSLWYGMLGLVRCLGVIILRGRKLGELQASNSSSTDGLQGLMAKFASIRSFLLLPLSVDRPMLACNRHWQQQSYIPVEHGSISAAVEKRCHDFEKSGIGSCDKHGTARAQVGVVRILVYLQKFLRIEKQLADN